MTPAVMKPSVPTMLSFNGGYADTAGYLALQGLFTSHVTGNFVTLGAALALGTSGIVAKLLALPVFCIVIMLTRFASYAIVPRSRPAIVTGMTLVTAMAIQNAVQRIHLGSSPPTTIMTGTTTQIMIDIADTMHGLAPEARDATRARLRRMTISVVSFASGAAVAALLFSQVANWCFAVPPVVALLARMAAGNNAPAAPAARGPLAGRERAVSGP